MTAPPATDRGLEVVHARKRYGAVEAVDDVSFTVARGEVVALLGPSGCGKSTLLRLVAGLEAPDGGTIAWDGADLAGVPVHRRRVGLKFQAFALFPHLSAGRNVAFGLRMTHVAPAVAAERARALLAQVGLAGFDERHPRDLSSGERERLALAAVLVADPDLLVLDEPTRGVDPPRKDDLAALLRAQAARRATLVVTNDLVFAGEVADRCVSTVAREAVLA